MLPAGGGDVAAAAAATTASGYQVLMLTSMPTATTHKKTAASPSSNPPKSTYILSFTHPQPNQAQNLLTHSRSRLFWYAILESLGIIAMAMYVFPCPSLIFYPKADEGWRVQACRYTSSKHSSPRPAGGTRCRPRLRAAPCIYDYWLLHIHEIIHPPTRTYTERRPPKFAGLRTYTLD